MEEGTGMVSLLAVSWVYITAKLQMISNSLKSIMVVVFLLLTLLDIKWELQMNVDMEKPLAHLDTLYYDLAAIYIIARQVARWSPTIVPVEHTNTYNIQPTSFFLRKDVETFTFDMGESFRRSHPLQEMNKLASFYIMCTKYIIYPYSLG